MLVVSVRNSLYRLVPKLSRESAGMFFCAKFHLDWFISLPGNDPNFTIIHRLQHYVFAQRSGVETKLNADAQLQTIPP